MIILNLFLLASSVFSCNNPDVTTAATSKADSITEEQKHLPENALKFTDNIPLHLRRSYNLTPASKVRIEKDEW